MVEFFRLTSRFLAAIDKKAATSFALSLFLLVFVVAMFVFGERWLRLDDSGALQALLSRAQNSPAAIFLVISVYVVLALTGFPQILMITATVLTFGPLNGALYAWVATMVSATLTFLLGWFLGGDWVRRFGGERVTQTVSFVARHGVLASALVRVVPSAPFIVVNSAAGAAQIPIWKYWIGTAIGIIPKIALVATLGSFALDKATLRQGVSGVSDFFTSRSAAELLVLAAIVPVWLILGFVVRRFYNRLSGADAEGAGSSVSSEAGSKPEGQ